MTSTLSTYSKQQFHADVSFNGTTTQVTSGNLYSNNLLLQGDGTNAYIRPTNASSTLYLGSNNINQLGILSNGNFSLYNSTFNSPKYIISNVNADDSAFVLQAGYSGATYSSIGIYSDWNGSSGNIGKIQFNTKGSQRMMINYDGNVGIGTASPSSLLHVNGTGKFIDISTPTINSGSADLRLSTGNGNTVFLNNDKSSGNVNINTGSPNSNVIINNGSLGIGISPAYKLDVNGNVNVSGGMRITSYMIGNTGIRSSQNFLYINKDQNYIVGATAGIVNTNGGYATDTLSVNADYHIKTGQYVWAESVIIYSDERIKNNIVDIEDDNALSILRQIQPKTYEYKDKVKRGNLNVIGFIAQEIKEVLPKAVSIITDYIPNFMTLCQISSTDASNIVLVTSPIDLSWNPLHDSSGNAFIDAEGNACSDASGNKQFKIKLYDQSNNEIECKTTDVLDKRSFLVDIADTKLSDGEYFLYGQEVDDFHSLDKNAIFTVVTAAVQDIDRKQVLDEAKIAELEAKNAALEVVVAQQQAQINAILAKIGGV
jgi:hypothetical protein